MRTHIGGLVLVDVAHSHGYGVFDMSRDGGRTEYMTKRNHHGLNTRRWDNGEFILFGDSHLSER
jgi:hypothetical protein